MIPTRARRQPTYRPALETLEDRRLPTVLLPAVTLGLTDAQTRRADVVVLWNSTMLQAIWNAATPPTAASRVEAMVGVAVYDAVDGIHPIYDLYPVPGLSARPASDASREAAAIAAADTVLNGLYPGQQALFDAEYQATRAGLPDTKRMADGLAWGQAVGNAVLAWRSHDGSGATSDYQPAPPGGPPGAYELTPDAGLEGKPPGFLPALAPQWGQVTPWTMSSPGQFLPPPPPALDSPEYAADFNQVKSLGAADSTTRTADETRYAHFWADVPGHSVTPPGHWDEIAEHLALQMGLNLEQDARLFALLNLGLADAAICCWNAKYIDNFWRPVTAIRDARASQINPATSADPGWTPLWNTPNFPSYTSGHSTFSGTASVILASVFGARTGFTIGSDDMPGYARSFASFAQAADEAGESRVVGGIHFAFDNTAGLTVGRDLGRYISQTFLRPLRGGGSESQCGRLTGGPWSSDVEASVLLTQPGPGLSGLKGGVPTTARRQDSPATSHQPRRKAPEFVRSGAQTAHDETAQTSRMGWKDHGFERPFGPSAEGAEFIPAQ
jgi:hypothetical protein